MSISPEKPKVLKVDSKGIPAELKSLDQWVSWRLETVGEGKWTKVLYIPGGLRRASSTNPNSWRSLSMALNDIAPGKKGRDGIGFVLTLDSRYVVIDLDHVIEHDRIDAPAQEIIDRFGSYAELSPSGTGVHIWCTGVLPDGKKGGRKGNVEMYSAGRFMTVTGRPIGGAR
ncbi:MAG: hypothetical protein ACR2OU_17240 [Thermomicrobiales bacterium]